MIDIEVKLKLPFLWGRATFRKKSWANINLIVGPNGSGKTLLSQAIAEQFSQNGYSIKFLKADRDGEEETLAILENNEEVRNKIQSVLSSMFGKSIVFKKNDDGTLLPVVVNRAWNVEYDLHEVECHGLKEIINLLVALYANTGNTCLIFDEPELHLHPQFQQFFAEELRRVSKRHPRRVYFIITHSPFFIDLHFPEELLGVVVCHTNREPTHIDSLGKTDMELFRRFLPRFNTYHKQFFFSDNQIFVEGYTDQQLFSNLLPYINTQRRVAGTGIIDVGGKDELGVFCKVCALLGTNSRIITDLDSLFSGKLREVFCADPRARQWLTKQYEKQLPFYASVFSSRELEHNITLEKLIIKLEKHLSDVGKFLCTYSGKIPLELTELVDKLKILDQKHEKAENIDTYKTVVLQGVCLHENDLGDILPVKLLPALVYIKNLFSIIIAACEACRVYILPRGCIEHYYTQTISYYMPVAGKDRLFHTELEFLLRSSADMIESSYGELLDILEKACA